jgi:hypothetical protein
MKSGLRRAGFGARQGNWLPVCTALSALVRAIAIVAVAVGGCAPVYHDPEPVMFDAAAVGPRSSSRAKPRVALPSAGLLKPQAPPDCGEAIAADPRPAARDPNRVTTAAIAEPASTARMLPSPDAEQVDRTGELALRIKLEYEAECYRQAEARVRERLHQLQSSISETVKSVNRSESR